MTVSELAKMDRARINKNLKKTTFAQDYRPRNASTGKEYGKANAGLLTVSAYDRGKEARNPRHPGEVHHVEYWATYKQWSGLGCHVRKGETGTRIYFKGRYFVVFSADQVTLPDELVPELEDVLEDIKEVDEARAVADRDISGTEYDAQHWNNVVQATGSDNVPF